MFKKLQVFGPAALRKMTRIVKTLTGAFSAGFSSGTTVP